MKRLVCLSFLIITIIGGGALVYSVWKTSPKTSEEFFKSGKRYYQQEKYSEATIEFANAIQKEPRNRNARYFLALCYISQRNLNAAAQELIALLEYFPGDLEANLSLGTLYLTGGRADASYFRRAAEIAQTILSKEPKNLAALILLGSASAGLQDYRSSVEQFEKAVMLDPLNTAAFVSLGTALTLQKNYLEAEEAFIKALEADPKDKSALISLGNYYRAVGNATKAESLLKEGFSLYPGEKDVYVHLIDFYYQSGRFDDLEGTLRDAQSKAAKDPLPSLILADFYVGRNRLMDAEQLLLQLKQKFPGNLNVAIQAAATLLAAQPTRAKTDIDEILKIDPKSPVGHVLLGVYQFTTGHYDAAQATLGTDPAINSPYPQPHFFLGNIAGRKGRIDEAYEHYQKALAINSGYLPARVALAETFLRRGSIADAREELRRVLATRADFVPARILQAGLDTAEKKYSEAETALTALLKEQPNNALVHRQMGLYYASRGRSVEAERSLRRALDLEPDSEEILRDIVSFYLRIKQIDAAIQTINAVPDDKKQPVHYELLGLVYSEAGRSQNAEESFRKALDKDPARVSTEVYLVDEYLRKGRRDEALKELNALIKQNPSSAGAYMTKGAIYEKLGNIEEAKLNFLQALKIDPNYEGAANELAYILADEGRDLDSALGWARLAREKQPENPAMADTLGWVYYKMGNHVLARDQLKFAVSKQPNNPIFLYHLAKIYKETGQVNEAQTALKKAIGSGSDFREKPLAVALLKEIAVKPSVRLILKAN